MNHKVSIVIPVYNVENSLEKCIRSILDQTYSNIEIVLVNDGSTDGSKIICEKYNNNSNVILVSQKNKGLPSARNTGVKNTTGDYIFFLDSDDTIDNDLIEKLVKASTNDTLSGSNIKDIFTDKEKPHNRIGRYKKEDFLNKVLNDEMQAFVWGYLYDAKICKQIEFDETIRYFEDLPYLIKYLKRTTEKYILFENTSFYNYYQNPNSITLSRNNLNDKINDLFITNKANKEETNNKYNDALDNRNTKILEALLQDSSKTELKKILNRFETPKYTGKTLRLKLFSSLYRKKNLNGLVRYYKFRKLAKKIILKFI